MFIQITVQCGDVKAEFREEVTGIGGASPFTVWMVS